MPSYAQSGENVVALGTADGACADNINTSSTAGIVGHVSGSATAASGVCNVASGDAIEIGFTSELSGESLSFTGLADDNLVTYYDAENNVVGTFNNLHHFIGELSHLTVSRVVVSNSADLLVKNGGFGFSDNTPGDVVNMNKPDFVPQWQLLSGSMDLFGPTGIAAAEGHYALDLSGAGVGSIAQTIQTEVGKQYIISFAMSGDLNGGVGEKKLTLSVAGVTETFSYYVTAENSWENMYWRYHTLAFTATETSTQIVFTSLVESWYGPIVDNVNVRLGSLCSPRTQLIPVTFENRLAEKVTMHWMDFDCVEGSGPVLEPNATGSGQVGIGHIFLIRGADGRIIGQYVADASVSNVIIGSH